MSAWTEAEIRVSEELQAMRLERYRAEQQTTAQHAARILQLEQANKALREALERFRELTPEAMKALMYTGRDGLLLADSLHRADAQAREALSQYKQCTPSTSAKP